MLGRHIVVISAFLLSLSASLSADPIVANEVVEDPESQEFFESPAEYFDGLRANRFVSFKLNNESVATVPTNVTLSISNRTLKCSVNNLTPNNGYIVNFYRNDVGFAFYRVRAYDIIWSTMNLNVLTDFYPVKGAQGAYPNFTVDISADSKLYGDYQCSVTLLGMLKNDNEITFDSNHVVIVKEKALSPELRWNKVFPKVNISFSLDNDKFIEDQVYEAKCRVFFDRPVTDYVVYFTYSNRMIGAYVVQTEPKSIKWQLFSSNLMASNLTILEQEGDSSYPIFSILMKPPISEDLKSFGCKLEIPSKKHPIRYYSNNFIFSSIIKVKLTKIKYENSITYFYCDVNITPSSLLSNIRISLLDSLQGLISDSPQKTQSKNQFYFTQSDYWSKLRYCKIQLENGDTYISEPMECQRHQTCE